MKYMKKLLTIFGVLFLFGCATPATTPPQSEPTLESDLFYPIENFQTGITLKPFGGYSTPRTSPIPNERFTGYHTGVDIEIPENIQDKEIPVYTIAKGTVKIVRSADGYGGVILIHHEIDGQAYSAVYGHIQFSSAKVKVGDIVTPGQKIAVLGKGNSPETDGERKHLHFSIKPGPNLDIKGYTSTELDLKNWLNPEEFLTSRKAEKPVENSRSQTVKLFYYNENLDKDASGNIQCTDKGVMAVERKIESADSQTEDTLRLLLTGGNLTPAERAKGISTEFPLEKFTLKSTELKNRILTLTFDDPANRTSGGSCRTAILWAQIEATAKQFPEVEQVKYLPEYIFQP